MANMAVIIELRALTFNKLIGLGDDPCLLCTIYKFLPEGSISDIIS